jgi:SAM-dependent methyltransferase
VDLVAPDGLVLGVDVDHRMLAAAADRVKQRAALIAGDGRVLPLKSGSVDRIRTDRALQHMRDPRLVLAEFRRVLRAGGIGVVAEPDWGTFVIDGGPTDTSDRFIQYTCREVVRNAALGREVARLGHDAGFVVANVVAFPAVFRDFATTDKIFGLARNVHAAADAGYLTSGDADTWLTDLRSAPMLAAITLFATTLLAVDR